MEQKKIGYGLVAAGLLLGVIVFMMQSSEDRYVQEYISQSGTCYLDDGTCLHDRSHAAHIAGYAVSAALLIFGSYLVYDRSDERLMKHHSEVTRALADAKREDRRRDEFAAFVSGFPQDVQKILMAVKEQDGIKQSTLRYRTGLSKTTLSLLLKDLEEKDIVSRKESGKTKQVYLRRRL